MNRGKLFPAILLFTMASTLSGSETPRPPATRTGFLAIANQAEHTALVVDLANGKTVTRLEVGVNGHEVAVSPNSRFLYVPIYGNSGVGKPGTDGQEVYVIEIAAGKTTSVFHLPKPIRPHCAKFGPDGLLYVSAELANALYALDPKDGKLVAEIPTGQPESHMFVISSDGKRAYTSNVGPGTVSVLDMQKRALITTIPVASYIQRIAISPDGKYVFTHDQEKPRIAVIDTATNKIARWIDLPATVYSSVSTPDGHWLLANAPSGKLFVVDLSNDKLAKSFDIPSAVGEIVLDRGAQHAYISCPQAGTIEVLNLQDWKLEEPIRLTKGVDGLEWIPAVN